MDVCKPFDMPSYNSCSYILSDFAPRLRFSYTICFLNLTLCGLICFISLKYGHGYCSYKGSQDVAVHLNMRSATGQNERQRQHQQLQDIIQAQTSTNQCFRLQSDIVVIPNEACTANHQHRPSPLETNKSVTLIPSEAVYVETNLSATRDIIVDVEHS
jgi:hypothetical protein